MSDGEAPRLLPPLQLAGLWQMAIDTWLLDRAVTRPGSAAGPGHCGAALRFYTWSRPTLSLGYHQRPETRWLELVAQGQLALVRRPSGGQAVLHGAGDLTYALLWPQAPTRRRQAYSRACQWLQQGFARLGLPLRFGEQSDPRPQGSCFAGSSSADLVHDDGAKRIGNAQLWRRGVLLQHGTILMEPRRDLWHQVLGQDPPALAPLPCSRPELVAVLLDCARTLEPFSAADWRCQALEPAEWSAIAGRLHRHRITGLQASDGVSQA